MCCSDHIQDFYNYNPHGQITSTEILFVTTALDLIRMKAALNGVYLFIAPWINLYLTDTPGESLAFKTSIGNLNQDWFIYPYHNASVIQNVRTQKFVN